MKKIINADSPKFWAIIAGLLCAVAAAILLLTGPKEGEPKKDEPVPTETAAEATETPRPTQDPRRKRIELSAKDEEDLFEMFSYADRWQPCTDQSARTEWMREYYATVRGKDYAYSNFDRAFFDEEADLEFTLTYSEWDAVNVLLGFPHVPFERPGITSFSADDSIRIGVSEEDIVRNGLLVLIWDNLGSEPIAVSQRCCLWRIYEDGVRERVDYFGEDDDLGDGTIEVPAHSFRPVAYSLDQFDSLDAGTYRLYINGTEPTGQWVEFTLPYPKLNSVQGADGMCENEDIIIRVIGIDHGTDALTLMVSWLNTGSKTFSFTDGWSLFGRGGEQYEYDPELIAGSPATDGAEYQLGPGELLTVDYRIDIEYVEEPGIYTIEFEAPSCRCSAFFRTPTDAERYWKLAEEHPEYIIDVNRACTVCALFDGEIKCALVRESMVSVMSDEAIRAMINDGGISPNDMRIILSNRYTGGEYGFRILGPEGGPAPEPEVAEAQLRQLLFGEPEPNGKQAQKRLEELRNEYPEYFDIPTEHGLEIYVWQKSRGALCFGMLPKPESGPQMSTVWILKPVTDINDAKLILSTYDIAPGNVDVIPYDHPTVYYKPIRGEGYISGIRCLLGLEDAP